MRLGDPADEDAMSWQSRTRDLRAKLKSRRFGLAELKQVIDGFESLRIFC